MNWKNFVHTPNFFDRETVSMSSLCKLYCC